MGQSLGGIDRAARGASQGWGPGLGRGMEQLNHFLCLALPKSHVFSQVQMSRRKRGDALTFSGMRIWDEAGGRSSHALLSFCTSEHPNIPTEHNVVTK